MKNVEMQLENGKLHIVVDLSQDFGPSSSGKTTIIASSEGNADVPGAAAGVKLGLNVYKSKGK